MSNNIAGKTVDVIILGASGNIAKHVIDILVQHDDVNLTLFLRHARRLRNGDIHRENYSIS